MDVLVGLRIDRRTLGDAIHRFQRNVVAADGTADGYSATFDRLDAYIAALSGNTGLNALDVNDFSARNIAPVRKPYRSSIRSRIGLNAAAKPVPSMRQHDIRGRDGQLAVSDELSILRKIAGCRDAAVTVDAQALIADVGRYEQPTV